MGKDEKDTLREAAEAAESLLPKYERQRATLDRKINSLRAVIDAHREITGKRGHAPAEATTPPGGQRQRHARGQIGRHVDAVLEGGGPLNEPTLRERIFEDFGIRYPRNTVSSALKRGEKAGRYTKEGGEWRKAG
jgi:hypothetical protein